RMHIIDSMEATDVVNLPTAEQMAAKLNISARTLIRRLRKEDRTYRDVLDEVLRAKAKEMIGRKDYSVQYIASSLGYADTKSFRRAFKRWFGMSPRDYRSLSVN
ncbi:MAG: helix-turn-helix transcriptional regulator, partial [Pseudomonadota bacterium]